MQFTLHRGDCIEVMRGIADNSIDSIVTDPPYELTAARPGGRSPATRGAVMKGFMGMAWDGTGIANSVEMWREAFRILKPGGHLLSFSGSRTYHRMTCAIEDAGFDIRDQIMWIYGSGFPKSMDVSKAIDKAAGAVREVVGVSSITGARAGSVIDDKRGYTPCRTFQNDEQVFNYKTSPATEAARQWDGWGTALKPAHEPICVARKPLVGTVLANVLAHGTGALNIGACRVATEEHLRAGAGATWAAIHRHEGRTGEPSAERTYGETGGTDFQMKPGVRGGDRLGRWPANVIHDGSDVVVGSFPDAAGQKTRVTGEEPAARGFSGAVKFGGLKGRDPSGDPRIEIETSSARFFYCAKASRADRSEGCEQLEQKIGGMVSNTSGQHITRRDEAYEAKPTGNFHPTVKPTELIAYLQRLVTPPGGTTLDMFMGSGTSGKAAMRGGFDFVGIEKDEDENGEPLGYMDISHARIQFEYDKVTAAAAAAAVVPPQTDMFSEVA